MASNNFINECKNYANCNRTGQIEILDTSTVLNQDNKIQEFTVDTGCYVDGEIIGTTYINKLEAKLIDSLNDTLEDKEIEAGVGVVYADTTSEDLSLGKYIVEKPTDEQIENTSSIVAYNELINHIDDVYVTELDYDNDTITIADVYDELCDILGLTPVTTTFTNSTLEVSANPFTNGEKNRDVLKSIEKVSCSFVKVNFDDNTIDLGWLSDTLDYTFNKDDYSSLEGGKIVYGPINTLIIRNSQVEDENVSQSDPESIAEYGEHKLVIMEDYFLYDATTRTAALDDIWDKVHNLTYVDCKLTSYTGKPFLNVGDKIRVYTDTNTYFDTYVLKHSFTYDGSFKSVIESPCLTEQEVKTKQDISLGEKLRNTQIIVNKQNGEIISLVDTSETINSKVNNAIDLATNASTTASDTSDELQQYKQIVSSQFTQTATDYTMLFTQALTAANNAASTEEAHYQTSQQYIRFSGSTITLGKIGSPFTAELSDTKLAFKQNGTEIAYISNNKLYITDGEIKTNFKIGNFEFVPRNGGLSFRKASD